MCTNNETEDIGDIIEEFLSEHYTPEIQKKYEKACQNLTSALDEFKEHYYDENGYNLIINIHDREKEFDSVKKKIEREKEKITDKEDIADIFQRITDLAGVRYSCPYSDQIVNSTKAIRIYLESKGYEVKLTGELYPDRDNLKTGNEEGYRYYHFFVKVPILIDSSGTKENMLCEIQVRSELQNSWAVKSHELIYKPKLFNHELGDHIGAKISKKIIQDCKNEMKIQSDLLNIVDEIFVNIRKKIEREVRCEK